MNTTGDPSIGRSHPLPARAWPARLGSLWFGLKAPVNRRAYLASGIFLMALKYLCDSLVYYMTSGVFLSPLIYLTNFTPSFTLRHKSFGDELLPAPLLALALLMLPFLWIGLTMSVRRAVDAGRTPWLGFVFLLPVLNHVGMIVLAVLPSRAPVVTREPPRSSTAPAMDKGLRQTLIAVLLPMAIGIGMCWVSIYGLGNYGGVLFLATPCFLGALSAYLLNRGAPKSLIYTVLISLVSMFAAGTGLLLFAFEGVFCLLMAAPIAGALVVCGAVLGWILTVNMPRLGAPLPLLIIALPSSAAIEGIVTTPALRQVTTIVEIDAPPSRVWDGVIHFAEMPPPSEWVFRAGISYPIRARLDREGVGATRRCEFSTGAFVEPITAWEPPLRLAFDVAEQPPSMTELSPYRNLHAPHLDGYMVARRGEFRLVPLPGERTRLEGTTWYTIAIYPETYWAIYAEMLLHQIHGRVLEHIKATVEERVALRE